jgi:hypothetical protein
MEPVAAGAASIPTREIQWGVGMPNDHAESLLIVETSLRTALQDDCVRQMRSDGPDGCTPVAVVRQAGDLVRR